MFAMQTGQILWIAKADRSDSGVCRRVPQAGAVEIPAQERVRWDRIEEDQARISAISVTTPPQFMST